MSDATIHVLVAIMGGIFPALAWPPQLNVGVVARGYQKTANTHRERMRIGLLCVQNSGATSGRQH